MRVAGITLPSAQAKRAAYAAGADAYRAREYLSSNPYAPIPPGDILLARLWRAGWHAERRKDPKQ